ncbi:hypothetical protein [Roseateles sp.]|uniref:hypothetical protein n=1 Tax=Roseateles sp. TaxID=1971397 RepID=UPI0031D0AAEF
MYCYRSDFHPWAPFSFFMTNGFDATQGASWGSSGGGMGQMGLPWWLAGALMRLGAAGLGCGWGWPQWRGDGAHRHCGHSVTPPIQNGAACCPAPAPAPTPLPVPAPAAVPAPLPAPAPIINAPREGAWNADKGGYIVGQSGQLQIDTLAPHYPSKSEDYQIQYRSAGGSWTDLGTANTLHGKSVTVKADPGSKLEFRINAYGEWQQAGTTMNTSGRDMAKVTKDGEGYKMGFENYKTGTDYEDLFLKLSDPKQPR